MGCLPAGWPIPAERSVPASAKTAPTGTAFPTAAIAAPWENNHDRTQIQRCGNSVIATHILEDSDELSAKEGTIESQVLALKKQIAAANHTLVKEYIDNGFSGPRFDRPALDQMRKDLKTDAFDVIYFFSPDRIGREVVIQTIIIEEILKHRKQLVINGKDYEKNPENHFSLTVLGAVAELERAKIIERTTRGRAPRLS
jgi:hypothetical protein